MMRHTVRRSRRATLAASALAALAATVTGCGSSNGEGGSVTVTTATGATAAKVVVGAHDVYFDPETVKAPAGKIDLELVERGSQPHTLVFEDVDGDKLSVTGGHKSDTRTVTLEAGTYTYYCDIPGHRGQGMEGTLTLG